MRIYAIVGTAGLAAAAVTVAASAQTASDLTPESFAPEPQRLDGTVDFTGQPGLEAPEGAERFSITIGSVAIDGGLPDLAPAEAALRARLTRGEIRVSEIFEAASDLERAYADAGFVLARVVLPEQELEDGGSLRLAVVSGFIERVDDAEVPDRLRRRIGQVTGPLVDAESPTLQDLERRLLIAGDTFGVALDSALAAGEDFGGTVLVLDPDYRAVTGFVGFDNDLGESLSSYSIDAGVEFNTVFGLGEVVYLRGSVVPGFSDDADGTGSLFGDDPRLRTLAAGAVVPVGANGLTLLVEGTISQSTPDDEVLLASDFRRLTVSARYPVIRSRDLNLYVSAGADLQGEEAEIVGASERLPLYDDDLRIARLGADASWVAGDEAILQGGVALSVGVDAFGARTATEDLPLSRDGAEPAFYKLSVSASYDRGLGERLAFSLNGRAQTSFGDPLVQSEQIGIATPSELSSFDAGDLTGDSGWVVRSEIAAPFEREATFGSVLFSPYVFAGTGQLYVDRPTAFEADTLNASVLGIGLDVLGQRTEDYGSASLRVEFGRGFRNDDRSDGNRFNIRTAVRF